MFKSFLFRADVKNELEGKANSGEVPHYITKFADMSEEEFKSNFLGFKNSVTSEIDDLLGKIETYTSKEYEKYHLDDIRYVNWAGKLTTPVKDQSYCGACWSFIIMIILSKLIKFNIEGHLLRRSKSNLIRFEMALQPQLTHCQLNRY